MVIARGRGGDDPERRQTVQLARADRDLGPHQQADDVAALRESRRVLDGHLGMTGQRVA
jgi:hypothetical protein